MHVLEGDAGVIEGEAGVLEGDEARGLGVGVGF